MKLTHKQKVKIARRMMSAVDIKTRTSIWRTQAWEERKRNIAMNELLKRTRAETRRKEALKLINKKENKKTWI